MATKYGDVTKFHSGSPRAARKHHLFYDGAKTSVCGKWEFTGETHPLDAQFPFGDDRDDCAACAAKYRKAQARLG